MIQDDIDELAARLVAGRYGELQCLRALALVEKQAPTLQASSPTGLMVPSEVYPSVSTCFGGASAFTVNARLGV